MQSFILKEYRIYKAKGISVFQEEEDGGDIHGIVLSHEPFQITLFIFSCFILSPIQFQKSPSNPGCSSVGTKSCVNRQ